MLLPHAKFELFWAAQPPPDAPHRRLESLAPVEFGTEEDALHAAALLIRAGQLVRQITRPDGSSMSEEEVRERCAPMVALLNRSVDKS